MQLRLTSAALAQRAMEWTRAETSDVRVRAYNIHGERLGVAGVGEGDQRLTFPSRLRVEQVLGFDHWIKAAPPGAEKWYELLGTWRPRVVVFQNGCIANPEDPIGMKGDTVTVLDTFVTRAVDEGKVSEASEATEESTELLAPTTPSKASDAGSCGNCQVLVLSGASSSDETSG